MNFSDLVLKRRSIRKFTDQTLESEQVELILKAGLSAPSSKNRKPLEFVAIEDKDILDKLVHCKASGNQAIGNCKLAIIVLGNPIESDVWVEDASIATIMMQLQAEDLGLGSCWIQIRNRETTVGVSSEDFIKDILDLPMHMRVLSIVALGHKDKEKAPIDEANLQWERIHINKY